MSPLITIGIALLAGFAPGIFWLWFFYRKDKIEPEPRGLVIKVYLLGIAVCIPVIVVQIPLLWLPPTVLAVIFAPLFEEWFKYLAVKKTVFTFKEFDEPMDGIVYSSACALGFASLENVFYLAEALSKNEGLTLFVIRALLSVPGHALFSGMWGYAMGMAKFSNLEESGKKRMMRRGLFLAMGLHAIFNLCASLAPIGAVGMLVAVPIFWVMIHKRIKKALNMSTHTVNNSAFFVSNKILNQPSSEQTGTDSNVNIENKP